MSEDRQRSFLDPAVVTRLARLPVCARGLVEGSFSGRHKSPHRGSSVEFSQYRKYVPGDDISTVDWRAYARSDRFYVKEFEADTNLRCYIAVDCSGSMIFKGEGTTRFDLARQLAATLANLLIRQGDAVGLHCYSNRVVRDIPARTSPKHLRAVYDTLAAMTPAGETDTVAVLHDLAENIRRRAMVVVISDFFTDVDPLLDCFQHLVYRKHDVAAFHLLDPLELNLRLDRPTRFRDLEGGHSILTEPAMIRTQYRRVLAAYLDQLRRGCLQNNVDYRQALTTATCEQILSDFLLDRVRRRKG